MGSLDGAGQHDAANRQSRAAGLVQKWFDDMPELPLELWSPTTVFEPLSPLAPTSPFFLSFLKNNAAAAAAAATTRSLPTDDPRRRPPSSGTEPDSPLAHHTTEPSSSPAAQGTFLSTPSRGSLVSCTSAGSAADTATTEDDSDDDSDDDGPRGRMPSTTRAGPDGGAGDDYYYAAANVGANGSHQGRRPKSSRSAKSERSSSPLFRKAWPRARHSNNNGSRDEGAAGMAGDTWGSSKVRLETPPPLTPAEFDALPTAIQRKVR